MQSQVSLQREGDLTQIKEEKAGEAEAGVRRSQAKECWQPADAVRGEKWIRLSLRVSGGSRALLIR